MKDIKSKYILEKVFGYIQAIKMLNIIKYNKNIQSILNITKNDCEEFLKVEIEIIKTRLAVNNQPNSSFTKRG